MLFCALLSACAAEPSELKEDLALVIEPDQQHVPLRYRCPAISISPARAQAHVSQDAAVERAVDRLIADQNIAIDPEHQARQASTQPVPFKLGPNTFALHRNFFYFQNAPSAVPSDGTVSLSLQWPCLEPLPQGYNFAEDDDASMRAILITARYLDPERITVPVAMQRALLPLDPRSPAQRSNPLESLDMRLQGDIAHGRLVPYYADIGAVQRYLRGRHPGNVRAHSRENALQIAKDWYIRRSTDAATLSVIKCDNREIPDGLQIEGSLVKDDPGVQRRASCDHLYALPALGMVVEMSYPRAFLLDWSRIEQRIEALLRPTGS
ncbi:hypothetical protein LU699_12730 [Luteimonas fraxinea]|uniref:Uncharacterized protein n=1 Tax=Luteimonas fraxinea TaxID=2901869 RepID=A0ABS8UF39_9GAMM|nr:hypothetical protein [Luteimonas fraxinea]MCD9098121.1 hypothetical protein [Luteimonas fraxinea]UHH09154.1 hypothetical protein LU699_12730 [Luteimonas fraxinea]